MMPVTQKAVGRYKPGETIFKDYVVKRSNIGEGQYAWVYEVANKARKRALKVFKTRIDWESGLEKDEGRGVKAVKDIQSLYLMEIVDYGYTTEHDESCLLMEYVKETLEDCLNKKGGKLDEALACHYFTEILKGLKDLKTFGIIHRDIKPGNLFLFSNTIKIGDYGFARFTSGSSASMSGARGTPAYSAPEVFKERYSHPADWWSASVILYRMLTGQMPFSGETQASVMKSVMFTEPDYSIVPEKFQSFLKTCFKKDSKERHKSVTEMMDAFENALSGITQGEDPASYGKRIPESSAENVFLGSLIDTSKTSGDVGTQRIMKPAYTLRSNPITVSKNEFNTVFGLNYVSRPKHYIKNKFQANGDGTISDFSTGLIWQRSGSNERMRFDQTQAYIQYLNQSLFAGYSDWRLPTIPELMSLIKKKKNGDLYIDPLFDNKQLWCWSSDGVESSSGAACYVYFPNGDVDSDNSDNDLSVRGVRIQTM